MKSDNSTHGDEPPSRGSLQSLKEFRSAGRGFWHDVSDADWNDWKWQLKNRVTTLAKLEEHLVLSEDERAGVLLSGDKLALAITPHFFNRYLA